MRRAPHKVIFGHQRIAARFLLVIATCTAIFSVCANDAEAQVALAIESLEGDGGTRTTNEEIRLGVNTQDCQGDATIVVEPTSTTTLIPGGGVDIWIGDADCSSATERTREDKVCEWAAHPQVIEGRFTLMLSQLLAAKPNYCSNNGDAQTIYALFTEVEQFEGEVTEYGTFELVIDGVVPSAPDVEQTDVEGDSQVSLSWTQGEQNTSYAVIPGGACGSNMPDYGSSLAEVGLNIRRATINPQDLGLAEGESVAVHVIAEDEAGNVSAASREVCVTRVTTVGFCEVYEGMGGEECSESGCAVTRVPKSPLPLLLLLLGAAYFARRRA